MEKLAVLIAAAGQGKRLGLGMNKAFVALGGVPTIVRVLAQINSLPGIGNIIVVMSEPELQEAALVLSAYQEEYYPELEWCLVAGGAERQDSVQAGLALVENEYVAVHDGARPFATAELFTRVWQQAQKTGAAIAAVPVKDTIKVVEDDGRVNSTPARATLWAVQTPQIFTTELLCRAYTYVVEHGLAVTDDASAVEALGESVYVVEGSYENNKITTPEDLVWAEALLEKKGMKRL